MFSRTIISPILRSTRLCLQLVVTWMRWNSGVPPHPGYRPAASSAHYITRCKHSLVFLRMGEIIARVNILS